MSTLTPCAFCAQTVTTMSLYRDNATAVGWLRSAQARNDMLNVARLGQHVTRTAKLYLAADDVLIDLARTGCTCTETLVYTPDLLGHELRRPRRVCDNCHYEESSIGNCQCLPF